MRPRHRPNSRVLLVEDNPTNRLVISKILEAIAGGVPT